VATSLCTKPPHYGFDQSANLARIIGKFWSRIWSSRASGVWSLTLTAAPCSRGLDLISTHRSDSQVAAIWAALVQPLLPQVSRHPLPLAVAARQQWRINNDWQVVGVENRRQHTTHLLMWLWSEPYTSLGLKVLLSIPDTVVGILIRHGCWTSVCCIRLYLN